MNLIFTLIPLAIIAYIVISAVIAYRKTPGTSILTAFEGSLTILWARLLTFSTMLIAFSAQIAGYLGDPAVGDAIKSAVKPEYVPIAVAVIAVVTEWARRRSLKA